MIIGGRAIRRRALLVAEIGNNHEGDAGRARAMIEAAAEAGADAVKFQTFRTEHYVSASDDARFRMLKGFELPPSAWVELAAVARSRGLLFLSTPFDLESAEILEPLVDAYKVASGDLLFFPLLDRIARTGKPVVLSTGAARLDEVDRSVAFLRDRWGDSGASRLGLLHCVSSYPAPADEANLRAIPTLAARYPEAAVGWSDHLLGIEACLAAVAVGARIVEKHFTLDKALSDFRDHRLSADPAEFAEMVRRARAVEEMLGTGEKGPRPSEAGSIPSNRRSIVAAANLPTGRRIEGDDLTWIRPAGGLAPGEEGLLVGRRLRRSVRFGEPIRPEDVE